MNIGIDIDDTIADTYSTLLEYVQEYITHDVMKDVEQSSEDMLAEMYETKFEGEDKRKGKEFFDKYYEKAVLNVEPKINAIESIKKLKEEGNQIYLITARFPSKKFDVEELTKNWLKKNHILYDELILNSQDKVAVAKKKQIDIFIDDSIKHCTEMVNAGIKTYIMDSTLNKDFNNEQVERVNSWTSLYQKIENDKKIKEED